MGDTGRGIRLVRAGGGALVAVGTAVVLTSCALLGGTPGAAVPTGDATVIDPSIPSATPTPTQAPTGSATPTPAATAVATATPAPSATATVAPVATRTAVTPFITSATASGGRIDISAIVPKVVESDGTCTVTATKGGTTKTVKASAAAAASYTGCQPLSVKGLAAGTWQVRLAYASPESAGLSASRTVTVG